MRDIKRNRNHGLGALIYQRFTPDLSRCTNAKITKFRINTSQSILKFLVSKDSILLNVHSK